MRLPRYPDYKSSGVDWIGRVPDHWKVQPLKRGYAIVGGSTPKSDVPAYWDGDIDWVTPADLSKLSGFEIRGSLRRITEAGLDSCGTSLVPPGSLILSTRAPIGSLGLATSHVCTNQGCKALVPRAEQRARFVAYALSIAGAALNVRGRGTTFLELPGDELGSFPIALPEVSEQDAVIAFLDRETDRIDALIAEQEKLLALLVEKRQATISHAVTRGLDPNVPMKDSGIAWLGEVPAHWSIFPIKWATSSIEQGWSPQCESHPVDSPDEWGVMKVGCVNGGIFDPAENKKLPAELEPVPAYALKRGDLLVSRANTRDLVGSAAVVPEDHPNLLLCDKLYRMRTDHNICEPRFVAAFLGTPQARSQIELQATGASSSMLNIGQSTILDMPLPLPPISEQIEILSWLESQVLKLDETRARVEHAICLLKERRGALISAAVTGQVDVRGLS
jgi:Restriction endonuclease S subunits